MLDIAKIYEWNKEFGNEPGTYKTELEINMLTEEFNETIKAMKVGDIVETIDGVVDIIVVAMGTLYKLGIPSAVVTQCFEEVIKSNFSKLPVTKNSEGKIQKGPNYERPNIKSILLDNSILV